MQVYVRIVLLSATLLAWTLRAENSGDETVIGENREAAAALPPVEVTPPWPVAGGMSALDASIQLGSLRVLKLDQAQSLYESAIEWSSDPATQQTRLEAVARIDGLIDRYLDCDDERERAKIVTALLALGAPFSVYEQVLLRGGVKMLIQQPAVALNVPVKNFKPLADDPEKNTPLTVSTTVTLPAHYTPYKRYPVSFGGDMSGEGECIQVASIIGENSAWKAAPLYMTWRGRSQFNALFNALLREFSIDPDRVIVSGFSVGGTAALRWGLYCPDRFSAIHADSSPPLSALDMPMIANYTGIPLLWHHNPTHTHTPPEAAQAFVDALRKANLNYCAINAGQEQQDADHVRAFVEKQVSARRDLHAKHLTLACNDPQVSRRAWLRVDTFDSRNNPEFEMRLHNPNGAQKGDTIETKHLREHPGAVTAAIDGNRVTLQSTFVSGLTLFFSEQMIDFSKPVTVLANGREVFSKRLTPSLEFMLNEARLTGRRDRTYSASCSITIGN